MIHRKVEGGDMRNGINILFDKASFGIVICLPVFIYGYSLFWYWYDLYVGESVLKVMVGVRWSRSNKKLHSRCTSWRTPYRSKMVATREDVEDGLIEIPSDTQLALLDWGSVS